MTRRKKDQNATKINRRRIEGDLGDIFLTAAYGPGPAGARARQPGAHWRCDEANDTFGHQTGVPHVTRGHAGPMTELLFRTVGFRDSSIARVALSDGPMLKGGER